MLRTSTCQACHFLADDSDAEVEVIRLTALTLRSLDQHRDSGHQLGQETRDDVRKGMVPVPKLMALMYLRSVFQAWTRS